MVVRKVGSEEAGREENIVLQEKIPHAVVPDSQEVNVSKNLVASQTSFV